MGKSSTPPKFVKVSKGQGWGTGGADLKNGEDHLLTEGGKVSLAPPSRGAPLPTLWSLPSPPRPAPPRALLTLSPRISPRCSCRRRFTSRMRLLWSSIALTFSASARRKLRISSSLLHCSSSSSDTLDRSSTAADGPAEAGGQLSAAAAAPLPAAFDMVSARRQVRVGGRGQATPKGAGAAGPPRSTPCALRRVSGTARGPLGWGHKVRAGRPSYLAIPARAPAHPRGRAASRARLPRRVPTPRKSMVRGAEELAPPR